MSDFFDYWAFFAFELTRPWMLWLLALLIPIGWFYYRSLSDFPRRQRLLSLACRVTVVVMLVLVLSGLALLKPTQRKWVVVAVDDSLSVSQEAAETKETFLTEVEAACKEDDRLSTLRFAADCTAMISGDALAQTLTEEERRGTNVARAIEIAAAAIPPGYLPEIVLLTDGRETQGDAVQVAATVDCPINVIPLRVRDEPEVQLAEVVAPAEVREGEPFYVEVVIVSNHEDSGYVDIYRGEILVSEQDSPIKVKPGENRFRFRQSIEGERQTDYDVRIRGFDDTLLDNNAASAVVFASGKPSVLVVDSNLHEMNHFRWSLEEQEMSVRLRPPDGIPRSLSEIQKFDCVVLSNIPATSMTLHQMEVIRTYVEDLGGGLVMIGGDQAFGLGGYYKTTLEEILPVRSNFEKEKEKPSLAMVLVIDKSGSMGGQKIELAKDAAKGAAELLGPRDQLGVIAFDGASYWVSEVHSAADRGYIIDRISSIEASGGTSIYPALSDAYDALSAANAKIKHVILLTDGHSQAGDFEGIARDMASARITLSGVAVGQQADQALLEQLAQIGGGRYYMCDDPTRVPQVFAKETVEASKSAINELPFVPLLVRPTQVLSGIDLQRIPFLLGYVMTRPKPTSEFILSSEAGDPVLVWWRYGLGMTVAFTSDAKSRWAAEWLTWPAFGQFWAQVIRNAMRKNESRGVFVDVVRDGQRVRVRVDSVDTAGRFINQAETKMTVIRPGLDESQLRLLQVAPGRYEADFKTDQSGAYHLELSQQQDGVLTFRQTRGFIVGYPEELRLGPANESMMRRIADISGGRYNPTAAMIFSSTDRSAQLVIALWPYLLMSALALFVIDVALRRIDFGLA